TGDTIDPTSDVTNSYRTAIGYKAFASGDAAIAVGTFNSADGARSSALGYEAHANADDSVALGSNSIADEANTVSVGSAGNERRIVNVADGNLSMTSTDAVNGRQLFGAMGAAANALGGGAAATAGGFIAPTYVIQGSSYNNVGAALDALDAKVTQLDTRVDVLDGGDPPALASNDTETPAAGTDASAPPTSSSKGELEKKAGDADGRTASNPDRSDEATGTLGDRLDKGGQPSTGGGISTGGDGNQQVAGVGTSNAPDAETLAEAKTYTDTTATKTLTAANDYTDAKFAAWDDTFTAFQGEIDTRFREQDRRIDRQGAMGAAMLNMATSAAGIRTQNRVGVGVGFQNGESALSIGYQRAISDRAVITVGGAFSGDETSVGLGAGFGW
ncbi:MAG: YadA-like family protein, partial [Luteimonas sp.]|nr:YadA-like family protein [Luteimonas sp.]